MNWVLFFKGWLLAIFLYCEFAAARTCPPRHNSFSAPSCPPRGGILNETYPVTAVMVSDQEQGYEFVKSFVTATLGGTNQSPTIVAAVTPENCKRLREEFGSRTAITCSNNSHTWQQDIGQALYDPRTGQPAFLINSQYDEYRDERSAAAMRASTFKALNSICGFSAKIRPVGKGSTAMGGNIESIPPDYCVVGDNGKGITNIDEVAKTHCGVNAPKIYPPVHFLDVGHVDEIMKTVRAPGEPPCNFKVLVADTNLGLKLLRDSQEPVIDPKDPKAQELFSSHIMRKICRSKVLREYDKAEGVDSHSSIQLLFFPKAFANPAEVMAIELDPDVIPDRSLSKRKQIDQIKAKFQELRNYLVRNRDLYVEEEYDRNLRFIDKQLKSIEDGLTKSGDNWNFFVDYYTRSDSIGGNSRFYYAKRSLISDLKLTQQELSDCADPAQFTSFLESTYGELNKKIGAELDSFANDLQAKLAKDPRLANCSNKDFIKRVPEYYEGNKKPYDSLSNASAQSIFPSSTNGVQLDNKLLFSDPIARPFKKYLTDLSTELGQSSGFINTTKAHRNKGNLHCSTNVLRYCRPLGRGR